jgi:hypothetical protein
MKKRICAFMLVFAMVLAMMVSASAAVKEPDSANGGGGIGPVITYHITKDNTPLYYEAGGPDSKGLVHKGNYCDKLGTSGSYTHVKMTSGPMFGKTGYVLSTYVALGY